MKVFGLEMRVLWFSSQNLKLMKIGKLWHDRYSVVIPLWLKLKGKQTIYIIYEFMNINEGKCKNRGQKESHNIRTSAARGEGRGRGVGSWRSIEGVSYSIWNVSVLKKR